MNKIKEILIGTNNIGKYREICNLLPENIKKYSPKDFKLLTPEESGESFEENSILKASYFSNKTFKLLLILFWINRLYLFVDNNLNLFLLIVIISEDILGEKFSALVFFLSEYEKTCKYDISKSSNNLYV